MARPAAALTMLVGIASGQPYTITISRVSVDSASQEANGGQNGDGVGSEWASISGDGRYVVFESEADNLVPGDTNLSTDIFLRDTQAGTTVCLTFGGDGASRQPAISSNGLAVAFWSEATNLVPGDLNGMPDVFVRQGGSIQRISTLGGGTPGISASGRYVTFEDGAGHVNVCDRRSGFVEDIGPGHYPSISPDGRWVGFQLTDSYLYDRQTDTIENLSPGGDARSDEPAISQDARYVVFNSYATNILPTPLPPFTWRAYLRDRVVDTIEVIAEGTDFRPSITSDGRYIAFDSYAVQGPWRNGRNAFLMDRLLGTTERVSLRAQGQECWRPQVNADGSRVAFYSNSWTIVSNDSNGVSDVFLWERN